MSRKRLKKILSPKSEYKHTSEAWKYANGVINGNIIACKWVRLACQRQEDDYKRSLKGWDYIFDFEKAERICKFIEQLPHVKGKWARSKEAIRLEPWQKFGLTTIFGWVKKKNGLRRFREVYFVRLGRMIRIDFV